MTGIILSFEEVGIKSSVAFLKCFSIDVFNLGKKCKEIQNILKPDLLKGHLFNLVSANTSVTYAGGCCLWHSKS